jgi:hypothetical protein
MHLLGQLKHGSYGNIDTVHPGTLRHYQENFGLEIEEDGDDFGEALDRCIAADINRNVHHEAVAVKEGDFPFQDDATFQVFEAAIAEMEARGLIPPGFGLRDDEWGDYGYPSAEVIQVARKEVIIPLSFKIWYPRAVRWVCALIALTLLAS